MYREKQGKIRPYNEFEFKDQKGYDLMKIDKRFLVRELLRLKEQNKRLKISIIEILKNSC